ncbi:MAG: LUD domain-containing protein, partial [Bacteroidia bacterium]|nr:LUD domain-containing protein [Bacteroidia bacterium]
PTKRRKNTQHLPPVHICLAFTSQLVGHIKDGLLLLKQKYADNFPSMLSLISGPSQCLDIERKTLSPMLGPGEIILFLIDDIAENSQNIYE